jgi:hypothetical protein
MLRHYTGLTPSNVARDAKYSVVSGTPVDQVRLIYRISSREHYLLTTGQHPLLVEIVNAAKIELNGQPRGVFYINEFCDVLIPDGEGGSYWAGHYDENLEFEYEDQILSPKAPAGLMPGDIWPGPHVGVKYILRAGGADIKYESRIGNRVLTVPLSDEIGTEPSARLAKRLAGIIGFSGGRFYVNERGELFSPARAGDGVSPVYLGNLDHDMWFAPPDGYDRP